MFCTQCGTARAGRQAFCVGCGSPFDSQSPPDERDASGRGDTPTALLSSWEPPRPTLLPPQASGPAGYDQLPGSHGQPPTWTPGARDREDSEAVPPSSGGRSKTVLAVVAAVAALALLGGLATFVFHDRASRVTTTATPAPPVTASTAPVTTTTPAAGSSTSSAAAVSTVPAAPPTPSATPTVDPQAVAQQELMQERVRDLSRISLSGQWVAQLASKYDGVPDPQQTTTTGSHVFRNADILQEFQRLQQQDPGGANIFLLLSTDYGSRHLADGHALWVTFADAGLSSKASVTAWCAEQFSYLSGKALSDACLPRQLLPPS